MRDICSGVFLVWAISDYRVFRTEGEWDGRLSDLAGIPW